MKCLLDPELTPDETALFRHIYGKSAQILPNCGRLEPVMFFRAGENPKIPGMQYRGIGLVAMDMPGSQRAKDNMAEALRNIIRQADANLAMMVLESWFVKPTENEAAYFKNEGCLPTMPSQHPNRMEIVFFSVEKPGGNSWSAWVPISRDGNGRPSIPSNPPKLEYLKAGGRFANLFEEDPELKPEARSSGDGDVGPAA
jgi:hypothetical protein